jgi:hypothetical protein
MRRLRSTFQQIFVAKAVQNITNKGNAGFSDKFLNSAVDARRRCYERINILRGLL